MIPGARITLRLPEHLCAFPRNRMPQLLCGNRRSSGWPHPKFALPKFTLIEEFFVRESIAARQCGPENLATNRCGPGCSNGRANLAERRNHRKTKNCKA